MKYKIEKKVKAHHKALRKESRDKEEQRRARKKGDDVKPTKKQKKQIKQKMAAKLAGGGSLYRPGALNTAPSAPSFKGVQKNKKDNGNILRTALVPSKKKGKKDMMATQFAWLTKKADQKGVVSKAVEYAWDKPGVRVSRRKRERESLGALGGFGKGARGGIRPMTYKIAVGER